MDWLYWDREDTWEREATWTGYAKQKTVVMSAATTPPPRKKKHIYIHTIYYDINVVVIQG